MKKLSRSQRFENAKGKLSEVICEFNDLKEEYQEWRDNLPENLENSPTAEKLDELLNLSAFDDLENAEGELEGAELPKGFGRD